MKRFLAWVLVFCLLIPPAAPSVSAASDDYKSWAQVEGRWKNLKLGTSSETVARSGCLATSVTKLLIQAGIKSADSFDIYDFVTTMNKKGGLSSVGTLQWAKVEACYPEFDFISHEFNGMRGTYDAAEYYDEIITWVRQGYHLVIRVKSNGYDHWVAVDESRTLKYNKVYIMDSRFKTGADKKNVGITLEGRYGTFYGVGAFKGGTTPDYCHCSEEREGFYTCKSTLLNVRSGHGTGYKKIGSIQKGDVVYISKGYDYNTSDNQTWYWGHVQTGNVSGYCSIGPGYMTKTGYAVHYDANNGENAPAVGMLPMGGSMTLSEQTPTRTGYVFAGWADTADAKTAQYQPGENFTADGSTTLYAVWQPKITVQSADCCADIGETATVSLKAEGNNLTYTWYYKNAGADAFRKTDAYTGNTYSVTMTEARSGRAVYCIITDPDGNTAKSKTAVIGKPLEIVTAPKTTYTPYGKTAKVSVKAEGVGLTYAWYIKNAGGTSYSKSSITGPTYSCKMDDTRNGRYLICYVYDRFGNKVKCDTVRLRMAATVTKQPANTSAAKGETAKVTLTAKGDGLTYTWYFKNAGASAFSKTASFTGNAYYAEMNESRSGRQVYCVVKDKYGKTAKSNTVTLSMTN